MNTKIDGAVKELFGSLEFASEPAGLYDPLRYMIAMGGKRIRPKLCLLAYSLYRGELSRAVLDAAAAIEVFHTFTLIHDDIMDRSPLRRGVETVWKKWNADTAILSGDVMLIDAYRRISGVPDAHCEVMNLFTRTAAEVCEGQQLDMDFESLDEVRMEDYEKMIGLKTGVLIACAAKMGALVAGAPSAEADALYRYGYELGMAFQVADDYLDAFGDESVFGKPIGGDIVNAKKSWLTTRAQIKSAGSPLGEELRKSMALPTGEPERNRTKIEAVKAVYCALGVDSDAKAEIRRYNERALEAVSGFPEESRAALASFAEALVGRAK